MSIYYFHTNPYFIGDNYVYFRWLQPEPYLDPKQCHLSYEKDDLKCNWPCSIKIITRDQYGHLVLVPDLRVNIYFEVSYIEKK